MKLGNLPRLLINVSLAIGYGWLAWEVLPFSVGIAALVDLIVGLGYATLFEYWYHYALHKLKIKKHAVHHLQYYGPRFRTSNKLATNISEDWYFFGVAFMLHLVVMWWLQATFWLAAGMILHYVSFEVLHWLIHRDGTWIERLLVKTPLVGRIWRWSLVHHQIHHKKPLKNYNFVPPCFWDWVYESREPSSSLSKR